ALGGVGDLRHTGLRTAPAWATSVLRSVSGDTATLDLRLYDGEDRLLLEAREFRLAALSPLDGALFETRWRPRPAAAEPPAPGTWLLLADTAGVAADLARRLDGSAPHVIARDGGEFAEEEPGRYVLDLADPDQLARLLDEAFPHEPPRHVVQLAALDAPAIEDAPTAGEAARLGCLSTLRLVRALADRAWAPRLHIVVRGSQAAGDSTHVTHPEQALAWGFGLAVAQEHPELRTTVRPRVRHLLDTARITGRTAALWVSVATQADAYDAGNCAYYGICDLEGRLMRAALPITHRCDAARTIRAQSLTRADLDAACASLLGQDAYVHDLVRDPGPIPGQHLSTLDLYVFAGREDYRTYAGAIFGISTDNGGMTLIGDPDDPANAPFAVMYQKSEDTGHAARVWNLNHEYTHYLDARDNLKGDFGRQTSIPDVWWIEGFAEYASYGYRGRTYTDAVSEAGRHTYRLSTLFQNTYANSDVTRTYAWGYLAVRYMLERHPADVHRMLERFRAGDYAGGYAVYATGIGTRYDADFDAWLTECAAGACAAATTAG
uniref:collagenase n=1 Tax=Streptomyces viridochromogenes TaxID=1938 RepID=UPI0015C4EB2D